MSRSKVLPFLFLCFLIFSFLSCNTTPQPIILGKDACDFCKMAIFNEHFGAEIINKKDKAFKFDDMHCVLGFIKSGSIEKKDIKEVFVVNFEEPHNFIPASKAFLLKSPDLHSPMGGNIACFDDQLKFEEAMKKLKGEEISWNTLLNAE